MYKEIITLFYEFTEDIENVFDKPWLKTAIVSHVSRHVDEKKSVIRDIVDELYKQKN